MKRNFFFARRARAQKSPIRLRIRPSISQNNTLLGNAAVRPSLSAAVWAAAHCFRVHSAAFIALYHFSTSFLLFFPVYRVLVALSMPVSVRGRRAKMTNLPMCKGFYDFMKKSLNLYWQSYDYVVYSHHHIEGDEQSGVDTSRNGAFRWSFRLRQHRKAEIQLLREQQL